MAKQSLTSALACNLLGQEAISLQKLWQIILKKALWHVISSVQMQFLSENYGKPASKRLFGM
jgi:hypothetical protein